jgi:geranylgeranyl reductase family protein
MNRGVVDEAEVVVVGGGPSGSTAADKLAELGHDVLLIDQSRFPRDKPCGDGLTHAAVATLERKEFGHLIAESQPIEDVRVVLGHGRDLAGWYRPWPRPPRHACTVPRRTLDSALFERAMERGARFREARVDGPLITDGEVNGIQLAGGEGEVRARSVIAADGATSRLRREAGIPPEPLGSHIYALRLYAHAEAALDPVFDIYVPLLYDGGLLAGYGWVFPVSEHCANLGVAYYEPPPGRPRARIRQVLAAFLENLQSQNGDRFGRFTDASNPIGAPIATQFRPERSQLGRLIFAGEAARAADPLSGEGISFALESGEVAAQQAHALLRGMRGQPLGTLISRRYTRLGQDLALPARLAAAAATGLSLVDRAYLPYVHKVQRVTSFAPDDPVFRHTDVYEALIRSTPTLGDDLDRVNETMLDSLRTRFPFTLEVTHREARAGGGPFAAALLLAVATARGGVEKPNYEAAAAIEILSLVSGAYSCIADRTSSEAGRVNNMLALLSGGFLMARAIDLVAQTGSSAATQVPRAARTLIECQCAELEDLGWIERTVDRYRDTSGRAAAVIARQAAELGTCSVDSDDAGRAVVRTSEELGQAWRICNEVRELTVGDELMGRPPGDDLRAGRITLPLILAIDGDPELGSELRSKPDAAGIRNLLTRVRNSGGLERAAQECRARVQASDTALSEVPVESSQVLRALGQLCLDRLTV